MSEGSNFRFLNFLILKTIFAGYCMFGLMFMASHVVSSLMNMEKMSQLAKLLYICIKAAIFMLFESFITPLLCGCWIDVCSLSLLVSKGTGYRKNSDHNSCFFRILHWQTAWHPMIHRLAHHWDFTGYLECFSYSIFIHSFCLLRKFFDLV